MPLYTEHLNLAKPTRDERYNIAVPNSNMDILDETIRRLEEENQALGEELAEKADRKPLEELNLPLAEGIQLSVGHSRATYVKTQENMVTVYMDVAAITGDIEINQLLATLPEGYRPGYLHVMPCFYQNTHDHSGLAQPVLVYPNGEILAAVDPQKSFNVARASFSFLATL